MAYRRSTMGLREFYIFIIAILALCWLSFGSSAEHRNDDPGPTLHLISCSDGDTCTAAQGETKLKIRLVGIDAPEIPHGGKQVGQPFGAEAKTFLNSLVRDKDVKLKIYGDDPYHRTLAEIFLDGRNINLEMVANGLAEVYRGKAKSGVNVPEYRRAEENARAKKIGMWATEARESPFVYRQKLRNGEKYEKKIKNN